MQTNSDVNRLTIPLFRKKLPNPDGRVRLPF
jgi:hypothetical protein